MTDEDREQMLNYARASLAVAESMGAFWNLIHNEQETQR